MKNEGRHIGLKRGIVSLESYDVRWKVMAEETIALLKNILGSNVIDIQHVGSTAIKGIKAKPIIDIAVGVDSFEAIMKYNALLAQNGIVYREQEHDNQLLYVMGDFEQDTRTHHIHVVRWNEAEWNNYIRFRDYLNEHEEMALEYSELKERLSRKYRDDRVAYTEGKRKMIQEILEKASRGMEHGQ